KYILDARPYDTSHQELKWENSELRQWLNEDFYDQAFNDEEKARIVATSPYDRRPDLIRTGNDGMESLVWPKEDLLDKVFLLTTYEAKDYFRTSAALAGKPTADAKDKIISSVDSEKCCWWLSSLGNNGAASFVDENGDISVSEGIPTAANYGVRPVIVMTTDSFESRKENIERLMTATPTPEPTPDPRETALSYAETVQFGTYNVSLIDWIILDTEGEYTLLMSKYVLFFEPYGFKDANTSWNNSPLNNSMNPGFYNSHLVGCGVEVVPSKEVGKDLPEGTVWAGMDTPYNFRVFILSKEEIEMLIPNPSDRVCGTAKYTDMRNASDEQGYCCYWLRTNEFGQSTYVVWDYGEIRDEFNYYDWVGVRPCVWVKLESEADQG
ncbi:MAG: hypothetical protein IKZ74_03115, partial [Clostridiales bacterium]|nr:hypothetical protein [Clostridiales bacterium]